MAGKLDAACMGAEVCDAVAVGITGPPGYGLAAPYAGTDGTYAGEAEVYAVAAVYAGECVYTDPAVVYVRADAEPADTLLFLLAGDSEPRGSMRDLISRMGEVDWLLTSP